MLNARGSEIAVQAGELGVRVLVVGSGGVGGYYGGILAQRGHDVTFVARGPHLAAMLERGLEIRSEGHSTLLHPVTAVQDPRDAGSDFELALFTVKGYDTVEAANALRPALGAKTAVLTLQNGVDSVDQLSTILGAEHVLAGTTRIETTIAEPGVIDHRSHLKAISFAELTGEITPRAEVIAAALREAGADVTLGTNARLIVWDKFIQIATNASITTVCQATIGEIRDTAEGAALYRALIDEVVAVGRACGVELPENMAEKTYASIMKLPATMKTSMQRDYERQKRVELDELTGSVVRRARETGIAAPHADAIYAALKVRALAFGGVPG